MKNKILEGMRRSRNVVFLTLFSTLLLAACQKESAVPEPKQDGETQELSLCISFPEMETDTEYVPMSRAQSTMVKMGNQYQYFILEDLGNGDYLVVDSSNEALFDPDQRWSATLEMVSGQTYSNIVTALRPGTYEIVIFTSPFYVTSNTSLVSGHIIPGPGRDPGDVFAIKYRLLYTWYDSGRETFYARQQFTVAKTTDLHTSNPNIINIQLERRSSKFRVLLQETSTEDNTNNGIPYFTDIPRSSSISGSVWTTLERQNPSEGRFPWGIDMWGRLWYDPNPPAAENNGHKYLNFYAYVLNYTNISPVNGKEYYIHKDGQIFHSMYHFSEPGTTIDVKTTDINVQYSSGDAMGTYTGAQHNFTLENNKISGMVLKLTNQRVAGEWAGNDDYVLEPVYSSPGVLLDPATLFEGNIEYAL